MNTATLVDLWEAQEEQRRLAVEARSDDHEVRAQAEAALLPLAERIASLQGVLWEDYSPAFTRCRDISHVWDVTEEVMDGEQYRRKLTCYRCNTTRSDVIAKSGELEARSYKHSRDYLMPRGMGGRYGKPFWRGISYLVASRRTH